MPTHALFNDAALPQLVVAPYRDALIDANLEACRLLRRDRRQLIHQRPSRLFCHALSALVVFTQELLENTRACTDCLKIEIDGDVRDLEVAGRVSRQGEELLLHLSLQRMDILEARRRRTDAQRHYQSGIK